MRSPEPMIVPRRPVGIAAAAFVVLFLALAAYAGWKATAGDAPPAPDAPEAPAASFKPPSPYQTEFAMAAVLGGFAALAAAGLAARLLAAPTHPDILRQQADDRLALLIFGGALGAVVTLFGAALFFLWFGDLVSWLNKEEKPKVWKPLTALLVFLAGTAGMFLAAQPARADERNAPGVRRAVYGVNLGIGAVLVFALLLVINIVAGLKLPARFDTTETGLYTITEGTRQYLMQLKQDVTLYGIVPNDGAGGTDVQRLLDAIREVNPQRLKVRQLSQDLDKAEIARLAAQHPIIRDPANGSLHFGMLLTTGADDSKAAFVRVEEFFGRAPAARGAPPRVQFQGEARIAREVLFLTENRSKPVVYFTQGAGEVAVGSPPAAEGVRSGEQLKTALVSDGCEVKPLKFESLGGDAKVPDDATVVIVADPKAKLAPATVNAITTYMLKKRPDGTSGKLVVMSGANPAGGAGGGVLQIGVEEFLESTFGIQMPSLALYSEPTNTQPPESVGVGMSRALTAESNTLALAIARPFEVSNTRFVNAKPNRDGGSTVAPRPLLVTVEDRVTWYEPGPVADPFKAFANLIRAAEAKDDNYQRVRLVNKAARPVAAIASEPAGENTPAANRCVVFGFGSAFEDAAGRGEARPIQADLISATVNWLRDRPAIANEANKVYGVYEPNRKMKWNQVFTLPVAVTLIGLAAMGLGLWAWRRK